MACTRLKCVSCDLLVSELLAFVQNKLKVLDEETLIRICNTAFSPAEIVEAKKLLFEAVPTKRMKVRKNEGKSVKDLEDIIDLLKHTDATDPEKIPIFVARELHRLPPVTFDHLDVTRLLRDINLLRDDLREIKNEYVTQKQVQILLDSSREKPIDTINRKRGAFVRINSFANDSGPMGLPHVNDGSLNSFQCNVSKECENMSLFLSSGQVPETSDVQCQGLAVGISARGGPTAVTTAKKDGACASSSLQPSGSETTLQALQEATSKSNEHIVSACLPCRATLVTNESETTMAENRETSAAECNISKPVDSSSRAENEARPAAYERERTMADVVRTRSERKQQVLRSDDGWITVQRKKTLSKNRFISETGRADSDLKFRAAPINKVPLYISNVCKSTKESDIVEYIRNKTNELVVLEKINCKRERVYNSFKLFVSRNKVHLFMDGNIWPEGISFRRFILFRNVDRHSSESRNKLSQ